MTVVAGIVENKTVWIGADSAGVNGWDLTVRRDPKVFRVGPCLIGYTSSFRMGQLLRYRLTIPEPSEPNQHDPFRYMATQFVDAVRETLKAGGYARKDNEVESGGTFLVGYAGRLFTVENDYQVAEALDGFDAVGCGDNLALGALCATAEWKTPADRLITALHVAERYSAGVRRPFTILQLPASVA